MASFGETLVAFGIARRRRGLVALVNVSVLPCYLTKSCHVRGHPLARRACFPEKCSQFEGGLCHGLAIDWRTTGIKTSSPWIVCYLLLSYW